MKTFFALALALLGLSTYGADTRGVTVDPITKVVAYPSGFWAANSNGIVAVMGGSSGGAVAAHAALTNGVHGISSFGALFNAQTSSSGGRTILGLGSISIKGDSDYQITNSLLTTLSTGVGTGLTSLDGSKITVGQIPVARMATGTPTGAKFIRDDGTLALPTWSSLSGTPTTIAGYGITDAPTFADLLDDAPTNALTYGRGNAAWLPLGLTNITGLQTALDNRQLTNASLTVLSAVSTTGAFNLSTISSLNGATITNLSADNLASGTVSTSRLPNSGASAGTYSNATVTVDVRGRVTGISAGTLSSGSSKSKSSVLVETEFLGATVSDAVKPWGNTTISSGVPSQLSSETNHFGIMRIASAGANSGTSTRLGDASSSVLLGGGEFTECVFAFEQTNSCTHWIGFIDANNTTESVDGIYLEQVNGYVRGKTSASSSRSTTTTSNLVAMSTWYSSKVDLSDDRSTATFRLYSESGSLLWSDTLTSNIPTNSANLTSAGFVTFHNSAATNLIKIDYVNFGRANAYR